MQKQKRQFTLKLQVADTPELVGWILSFGSGVRVIKPSPLAEKVRSIAIEIAQHE
jgi:predicted DNA-binding transcriptional regulator YafY